MRGTGYSQAEVADLLSSFLRLGRRRKEGGGKRKKKGRTPGTLLCICPLVRLSSGGKEIGRERLERSSTTFCECNC